MNIETIYLIQNNPYYKQFLREESHHYQMLYRDDSYLKELDDLVKKKYGLRFTDKLEKIRQNMNTISTFMRLME